MPDTELPPALQLLRASQDRALEREGIPMLLALVNEIGPMPDAAEDDVRAEGAGIAGEMDALWDALAPTGRDSDMGRVITVLVSASYADFGREEAR